jgi:hypothetical protein
VPVIFENKISGGPNRRVFFPIHNTALTDRSYINVFCKRNIKILKVVTNEK